MITLPYPQVNISSPQGREQMVDNGISVMDVLEPGWVDRVDVGKIDMFSLDMCILGQVTGYPDGSGFYLAGMARIFYLLGDELYLSSGVFDAFSGDDKIWKRKVSELQKS